jgi:hypothetical protein
MRAVFAISACFLAMVACSSGSDGKPAGAGPVTAFEKATAGSTWKSECQRDQTGFFNEKLVLNPGGTGTSATDYYQTQGCVGQPVRTEGPTSFTYTTGQPSAQDGATPVTLHFAGEKPITVDFLIQGDTLIVRMAEGSVTYTRPPTPGQASGQTPGTSGPVTGTDFERVAVGSWITKDCYQGGDSSSTMKLKLTISVNGRGSYVESIFHSPSCQGQAQSANNSDFTYTVDRYANGGGQLTINGQSAVDVSISGNEMTISDANGTVVYVRAN